MKKVVQTSDIIIIVKLIGYYINLQASKYNLLNQTIFNLFPKTFIFHSSHASFQIRNKIPRIIALYSPLLC